jgi:serine/threonine protein phosphatase PrpC
VPGQFFLSARALYLAGGAAVTIVIVNTSEIWCANVGDSRAVMSTVRGAGKL